MSEKFCVDCRHHLKKKSEDLCGRRSGEKTDRVTGKVTKWIGLPCHWDRSRETFMGEPMCGEDAQYWVPKTDRED